MSKEEILHAALALSDDDRILLAESLLDSLSDGSAVEEAWRIEIRRRINMLNAGETETVPWATAEKQIFGA